MMFNLCMNSVNILSVFRIVKCDVQFMSEQDEQNIFSVFRIVKCDVQFMSEQDEHLLCVQDC